MERMKQIRPIDEAAMEASQRQWNRIAKPLHSLGMLEEAIIQIAGIIGDANVQLEKRCCVDMCADNGVLCENVTQSDSGVTAAVARAMADGTSNINLMAAAVGTDVLTVDIGMATDVSHERVIRKKIAYGTDNIAVGPAMTKRQAQDAISVGIDMIRQCKDMGYQIVAAGEMGIGNTTTSSAIASVLLKRPVEEVTGRGAGLDSAGLVRKIDTIKRAIAVNCPDETDALDLLSKLGGYDIAGMTGLYLGGAIYHIPIVIDGLISTVAASLAAMLHPVCAQYMLAAHTSKEPAGRAMLAHMGKKTPICANLSLGEGTGAVLLFPMLDAALAVYHSLHQFEALSIEQYKEYGEA